MDLNLDDFQQVSLYQYVLYDDKDKTYTKSHNGEYIRYIRKGASKSKERVLEVINKRIQEIKSKLKYKQEKLNTCITLRDRILSGDDEAVENVSQFTFWR